MNNTTLLTVIGIEQKDDGTHFRLNGTGDVKDFHVPGRLSFTPNQVIFYRLRDPMVELGLPKEDKIMHEYYDRVIFIGDKTKSIDGREMQILEKESTRNGIPKDYLV